MSLLRVSIGEHREAFYPPPPPKKKKFAAGAKMFGLEQKPGKKAVFGQISAIFLDFFRFFPILVVFLKIRAAGAEIFIPPGRRGPP